MTSGITRGRSTRWLLPALPRALRACMTADSKGWRGVGPGAVVLLVQRPLTTARRRRAAKRRARMSERPDRVLRAGPGNRFAPSAATAGPTVLPSTKKSAASPRSPKEDAQSSSARMCFKALISNTERIIFRATNADHRARRRLEALPRLRPGAIDARSAPSGATWPMGPCGDYGTLGGMPEKPAFANAPAFIWSAGEAQAIVATMAAAGAGSAGTRSPAAPGVSKTDCETISSDLRHIRDSRSEACPRRRLAHVLGIAVLPPASHCRSSTAGNRRRPEIRRDRARATIDACPLPLRSCR